jgi:hypothetical protein
MKKNNYLSPHPSILQTNIATTMTVPISWQLAHAFEMNLAFSLEKVNDQQTKFIYAGSNKGINFVGRAMLKLGSGKKSDQVIHELREHEHASLS